MDEKKIINLSEEIVYAITDICMGKSKSGLINSVHKTLSKDQLLFSQLRDAYVNYLQSIDGKVDEVMEVKALSDFRYGIVDIYDKATK